MRRNAVHANLHERWKVLCGGIWYCADEQSIKNALTRYIRFSGGQMTIRPSFAYAELESERTPQSAATAFVDGRDKKRKKFLRLFRCRENVVIPLQKEDAAAAAVWR